MADINEKYLLILKEELEKYYNLTSDEAFLAVNKSAVKQMLENKESAEWQMHQPIQSTVEEIYCQYKGIPILV